MAYSILIIEDNPDVTHVVQHELERAGFVAHTADTGAGGLAQAHDLSPDLVILDLGLPDFDGAEVARRLRTSTEVPIIILTAVDAIERKVELFGFGVSDYITKPFDTADLIARVNAQLRQFHARDGVTLGALTLSLPTHEAAYAGRALALSPEEFGVLSRLARQPGRIFSLEQLQVDDTAVETLRAKLRAAEAPDLLRPVRGMGYALRRPSEDRATPESPLQPS